MREKDNATSLYVCTYIVCRGGSSSDRKPARTDATVVRIAALATDVPFQGLSNAPTLELHAGVPFTLFGRRKFTSATSESRLAL
jgi:hypothetical protein